MWLLNCETTQLKPFEDANCPPYAILSHRWERQEVSFQDVMAGQHTELEGWQKIKACCKEAKRGGLDYVWVDTCCIDKRSSAELSEAINSMYKWYKQAQVCYAYLADVKSHELCVDGPKLTDSVWFTRGWTLQELLAPKILKFYDCRWKFLGSKRHHAETIQKKTGIHINALVDFVPQDYCIAQKMSWAAGRDTTRVEDRTYSLLGLFDVSMPLLYGEGDKAFRRLQNELISSSTDNSIFAWSIQLEPPRKGNLLASSPDCFQWDPSHIFVPESISTSINKEGLSGSFQLRPFCLDIFATFVGSIANFDRSDDYHESKSRYLIIFLKEVEHNLYQRVILDGKGCEVVSGFFNFCDNDLFPKEFEQEQSPKILIQLKPVLSRSSTVMKDILCDVREFDHLTPGTLWDGLRSRQFDNKNSLRKSIMRTAPSYAHIRPRNQLLRLSDPEIGLNFHPCLLFPPSWDPPPGATAPMIIFTHNFTSTPTVLVQRPDYERVDQHWDKLAHFHRNPLILPGVYHGRHLAVVKTKDWKPPAGQYTPEDSRSLKRAFHEIDKEAANGAKLLQLGDHFKVAFIPLDPSGHIAAYLVFLAFSNHVPEEEVSKIPREWLYPPPEGSKP